MMTKSSPNATVRAGVSDAAVERATGRNWKQWQSALDRAGAREWPHKEIAIYLGEKHGLSPWWRQMVTVGYEKAIERRVLGQTAETGFQIGVQSTLPLDIDQAWELIASRRGATLWLGATPRAVRFEVGSSYTTHEGVGGTFRVVVPRKRLRLTWHPKNWDSASTLQVTLVAGSGGKTSIRFHQEKLHDATARAEMKAHWQQVLAALRAEVDGASETQPRRMVRKHK